MSASLVETAAGGEAHPAGSVLRLFNTLTRKLGVFEPLRPGRAGLYTCGVTVYNYAHIGNLRTYLFSDLLRRVLQAEGLEVVHVENITDVGHLTSDADQGEDKMELNARLQGKSAWDIAAFYTEAFKHDLERLQILEPTVWSRATDHIPEMIALIQEIEERGFTYPTEDGIYFDTSLYPEYGRLARLDLSGQQAGARVEVNEDKRNPQDFALWKLSPPGQKRQMEWDSPWGRGFPGWHIECSAMSARYLGVPFDLHTGGVDHIAVHHTNEIAQTWAATGRLLSNWWLHGEFLEMRNRKMSRSSGEFVTLQSLIDQGYSPMAFRYLTYQAHYRTHLTFTDESLAGAAASLKALHDLFATLPPGEGEAPDAPSLAAFRAALREDLNAPQALAVVQRVARDRDLPPAVRRATLLEMNALMPLGLEAVAAVDAGPVEAPPEVQQLARERDEARKARDFALADTLRGRLTELGWEVRDTPGGAELRRRPG